MDGSGSSVASAVRNMDALLNAKCGSPFDWTIVVALCDTLNGYSKHDAETVINILYVRLDTAQRARTKNLTGPGAAVAEERTVRALMLLDSLVKNVAAARTVAASKKTLSLLEKIADLQHKTASARSSRSKKKVREQSRGNVLSAYRGGELLSEDEEESVSILDPSVHDDDVVDDSEKKTKEDDERRDVGGAEDWAMRIMQAWGMLHPAEFPLFLKAMEKWKKAGVVFPAPSPEDLLPLPKFTQTSAPAKPSQAPVDPDAQAKKVMTEVIQQLSSVACDTSVLLCEMCSASNASAEEGEDEEIDTAELRATLVSQCKNMRTAMTAVVEAALSGKSLPPLRKGGPRVLVYKSGADEAGREAAVAYLLGVVERLDSAITMNDECTKQQARMKEERKKPKKPSSSESTDALKPSSSTESSSAKTTSSVPDSSSTQNVPLSSSSSSSSSTAAATSNNEVFNPFNLPESVIIPQTSSSSSSTNTTTMTTNNANTMNTTAVPLTPTTPSSTSYLDELLGTAPTTTQSSSSTQPTTPKRDALTELLFS